jgi:hypothetical protein
MSVARPQLTVPRRSLAALAVAALVAALTMPAAAGPAARVVLVIAGSLFAAVGAVNLLRSVPYVGSSRFEPSTRARERRDVPAELRTLIQALQGSGDRNAERALDPMVRQHVRAMAVKRLAALRLDAEDPADHPAIERRVSSPLWAVVAEGPSAGGSGHLPSTQIPATSLPALLDELERL